MNGGIHFNLLNKSLKFIITLFFINFFISFLFILLDHTFFNNHFIISFYDHFKYYFIFIISLDHLYKNYHLIIITKLAILLR